MSGYPLFILEFVLCTNSSWFWFRIANELCEFRNYLFYACKSSQSASSLVSCTKNALALSRILDADRALTTG